MSAADTAASSTKNKSALSKAITMSGQIAGQAAVAADQLWNKPALQTAIQVLEQLSDIGRTLPFVAPAFVLLSLIIQIENQARDADAKCNDLVDRITFMLGHLAVLRRVKVMDVTRQVIDRMILTLRDAASLIQAYRKQSLIARRLNVSNGDKFASCVQAVNLCSSDLMMSLQIHQSSQLDILTRSVPVDPEDKAAQSFISHHGGVDAIKQDEALVAEFAEELHLDMAGDVMEQVNTDISDLMQENQVRLERMLKASIGTGIVDGIKELVAQMSDSDKEQRFVCVQCDAPFRNSTNGPKSCNFHRAEYSSWDKCYSCCGETSKDSRPCQYQYHRAEHHCDYPYGPFFSRAREINNYVNTVDKWISLEDKSLVNNTAQKAFVGRLLRWVSRGDLLDQPTIIIGVGTIWYSEKYFFDMFTTKDLQSISQIVHMTGNSMIFRTTPEESEYAMAEWEISSEGTISGVRLTAKAATSSTPFVRVCPIDIATCTKSGDILAISEGSLRSYKSQTPYILPETIRIGPELSDKPVRPTRTNFKTRTSPNLPIILIPSAEPPLKANPEFASFKSDIFEGVVSVFNKSPTTSTNPITIASVSASFRLIGDENYVPVNSFEVLDGAQLPITIGPRQSWALKFRIRVPRTEHDAALQVRWYNRAFVARKRPLRVRLSIQDIEGEECSLILEHVFDPLFPLEKQEQTDLAFFYFDDPELWSRHNIHVERGSRDQIVTFRGSTNSNAFSVNGLQKIVYHAVKTGETEVDLKIGGEKEGGAWEWGAWALVDLSCKRVYAFKVLLKQGYLASKQTMACLGYVLCPEYGDVIDEPRAIQYAVEMVKLPELELSLVQDVGQDDSVDDFVPESPKLPHPASTGEPTTTSASSPHQMVVSEDLNARLTSIDSNLARIATAVERLVDHLIGSYGIPIPPSLSRPDQRR